MKFTVPQFTEHEAKIVGPLTFKQSAYIGFAAVIGFILYYSAPFHIFLPITIILGLGSFALAFLKINGRSLPTILTNCLNFLISSKIYLWQKTKIDAEQGRSIKTQRKTNIETFKKSSLTKPLKATKTSYLRKIKTKIN